MPTEPSFTTINSLQERGRQYILATDGRVGIVAALDAAMATAGTETGGRGGIVRRGNTIARRCRRGGLIRWLTRDGYLRNRPRAEFEVHRAAAEAGLPVPELLGVCWEKCGFLYRGALATRAIDAVELLDALRNSGEKPEAHLRATGAAAARMHNAGIWHADLQVRNVLVDDTGAIYLIDWDRSRQRKGLSRYQRAMNCYRFRRSLEKHGFPPAYFVHFCAGYGAAPGLPLLGWWYALRSRVSGRAAPRDMGNA